MEKSYTWFEKRRKIKALELAQQQIIKALDTATLLHRAVQSLAQGLKKGSKPEYSASISNRRG